ncbi:magnesium transporter [Clostridium sp. 1001271B_151109_B4]|uniref:magnesium transporter n=1 Tax=Clostridium sp. 1001271B_151109_B4 TaxID=2787148 RepID=UPI0018A8C745|nr:magnesium transporter [Clostridium sp. 1001271B_151109_B4]
MKLNMNKDELRRFLLHAPQSSIIKYVESIHPVDILDILRDYPKDKEDILYRLPEGLIADIIDEADNEEKYSILMEFSENKQKNIVEEMSSDELTDLLGMLDEEKANKILEKMTDEDARKVRQLLSYDPDTAAGIMATEFVALKENMTVEETLKYLQKYGEENENIYDLYVVDNFDKLKGVISLRELVTNNFNTRISDVIHTKIEGILYNTDQEEVGHRFEKYGYLTMPVVDNSNRLLGVVTFDDVMQILRDETTEDIHRLGGVDEGEKVDGSLKDSVKSRLPWLIVNLFTAILAAAVVGMFEGTIQAVVSLATFMPIVTGMGGNAGTQTLTIIVRGLALGELNFKNMKKVFFKEVGVGVVTGVVIGFIIGVLGYMWEGNFMFGIIISVAMLLNMIVATITGYLVPVVLKKFKVDPALASSIFVTTFTDVLGFFFFLGLATLLIQYLM